MLGITGFSLTLPATRLAVTSLDPTFVGLGRAIAAAGLAAIALWLGRASIPSAGQWGRLGGTAFGVVVGFPLLSTFAMTSVPASHGAVIGGLIPLFTAMFGAWLAGERPSPLFWASTLAGSAVIAGFSFFSGDGSFHAGDLLLFGAVVAGGYGYAEGARLARELGAWQTISWALLLSVPVLIWPVLKAAPPSIAAVSWTSILGFAYVSVISMYLAFFAWYRGLATGGIARIGQLQLLQPFLTLIGAMLILNETIYWSQMIVAVIVLGCVIAGRKATPLPRAVGSKK